MPKKDEVSKTRKILQQLQKIPANKKCAECGSKQPTWASTNLGVFVCIRCSSVHRSMGTHISKVKSATLDIWKMDTVAHFREQGGNQKVNTIYEAKLPEGQKPNPGSDMYLVERFIRDKYERKMWFSRKKRHKKKKGKDSSSDSDEKSGEDDSDSSDVSSKSSEKKKKSKKKPSKKREKVRNKKPIAKKISEVAPPEKKKKKLKSEPQIAPEPVIDILDVSVLSFGDDHENDKNVIFDSKSFVDDLLSSEKKDQFANKPKPSADLDFGDFFGGPVKSQSTPKATSSEPSIKPSTNDIMGMFKHKPPAMKSQDIFGAAGPRAQHMPPIGVLGPQMPNIMVRQPPMQTAQLGFTPVMNQNMMYYPQQPMRNVPLFNQAPTPQRGRGNLSSNMYQNRQHPSPGFSNPKPQSSAFDALMSGNVPIKSQPPSTKSPSSRYVPSKPSGQSLNIDLNGWMS